MADREPRHGIAVGEARAPAGMRIYAIGDVHGRVDLLKKLHAAIEKEIAADRPDDWRIVFLGDYVDRGADSKGVIDFLLELGPDGERIAALAGNHDIGFADFLHRPDAGGIFANYGGRDTAASYGAGFDMSSAAAMARSHEALLDAVPESHRAFLDALPYSLSLGDYFFCHAGVRPGLPLEHQQPHDLAWIRGDFLGHRGLLEKVIVHGHTPVPAVDFQRNRVNVDTGAYFSGVLSALVLEEDRTRTIAARGKAQPRE